MTKYVGNRLTVFEDADALRSEQMTALANKMNYSETALIEGGPPDDGYDAYVFIPDGRIPFAGYPTLRTAAVLRSHFSVGDEMTLNLGIGPIPVEIRGDGSDNKRCWITQNAPGFGVELNRGTLAEALSLDANDFGAGRPMQVVSISLPAVMIPLHDRDALTQSEASTPAYRSLFDDVGIGNLFLSCPDSRDDANDFATQVYAPDCGTTGDPTAGSTNGCFAGYLARHRYLGDDEIEVTVEQGHGMSRLSQLYLEAEGCGDEVAVRVSGRVKFVSMSRLV